MAADDGTHVLISLDLKDKKQVKNRVTKPKSKSKANTGTAPSKNKIRLRKSSTIQPHWSSLRLAPQDILDTVQEEFNNNINAIVHKHNLNNQLIIQPYVLLSTNTSVIGQMSREKGCRHQVYHHFHSLTIQRDYLVTKLHAYYIYKTTDEIKSIHDSLSRDSGLLIYCASLW